MRQLEFYQCAAPEFLRKKYESIGGKDLELQAADLPNGEQIRVQSGWDTHPFLFIGLTYFHYSVSIGKKGERGVTRIATDEECELVSDLFFMTECEEKEMNDGLRNFYQTGWTYEKDHFIQKGEAVFIDGKVRVHLKEEKATEVIEGPVIVDRWWVVDPEKGLVFYDNGKSRSPQCNRFEKVAKELGSVLYPGCEVKFFELVYAGHVLVPVSVQGENDESRVNGP